MADEKFSNLTAMAATDVDTASDIVCVSDISANESKKITIDNLKISMNSGWTVVETNATGTAVSAEEILADTSGGAFTYNLPASPSGGDRVRFVDDGASWGTNNLTVGRNGSTINGAASDDTLSTNNGWAEYVYSASNTTWRKRT